MDIVGQVGIGNMKRSEVCGVYERELVVLNGKMMEFFDRQTRVEKKIKKVGIRKRTEEEKSCVKQEMWD